jgi:hypothetical protein
MRVAQHRNFAFATATLMVYWKDATAQNTSRKSPVDYVDPLIGTINGGMDVNREKLMLDVK